MHSRKPVLGLLLAALSGVLYGTLTYMGFSVMNSGCTITQMLFSRFFLAACVMLPFVLRPRVWQGISLRQLLPVMVIGSLGFGVCSYGHFLAATRMGSGIAMVLFFTFPLMVALIQGLRGHEQINRETKGALALMVVGIALLGDYSHGSFDGIGVMLALAAALGYAIYIVVGKSPALSASVVTFVVCLGSAMVFRTLMWYQQEEFSFFLFGPEQMASTLALAVMCTIAPMFLLLKAMDHISTVAGSMLSVLEPLTTIALGILLLHESIGALQWLGIALVLGSALAVHAKAA